MTKENKLQGYDNLWRAILKKKKKFKRFQTIYPFRLLSFCIKYTHDILQILLLFNTFAKRVKAYLNIFTKDISIKKANQDHKKKENLASYPRKFDFTWCFWATCITI